MKLLKFYLALILFVGTTSFAQDQMNEKTADRSEFTVPTRSASINGTLDGPGTFNRLAWNGSDLTCNGTGGFLSSVGTNVFYDVYEIYSPAGENLVASLTSGSDSYLLLYCNPFTPATPLVNARAGDDDDGVGTDAAFLPTDNIYLEENTSYFLVVSSYANGATFNYTLNIDGGVVIGSPTPVPISNWAIVLAVLGIVAFAVYRIRR